MSANRMSLLQALKSSFQKSSLTVCAFLNFRWRKLSSCCINCTSTNLRTALSTFKKGKHGEDGVISCVVTERSASSLSANGHLPQTKPTQVWRPKCSTPLPS
ncbi:hypothetical protein M406DRAFT_55380, partial [Cryphonectria parasitica EP155]